jgi:hypothetical protein
MLSGYLSVHYCVWCEDMIAYGSLSPYTDEINIHEIIRRDDKRSALNRGVCGDEHA